MARPGAGGINTENWMRGAENSGGRPNERSSTADSARRAAPSSACAALSPAPRFALSALRLAATPWQNPTCSHP